MHSDYDKLESPTMCAFKKLHSEFTNLLMVIAEEMGIFRLLDWLEGKLSE